MTTNAFQKTVWEYYKRNKRDLPWRKTTNIYRIWVSEVMLQQTQVSRVIEKYHSFLKKFPNIEALAQASQSDVLREWQGLGYNRRGLNLWRAAKEVLEKYKGKIPNDTATLETLPGIGHYTARAILAFSKNQPAVFIETNIRTVYLHSFFKNRTTPVDDKELLRFVEKTLDVNNPREWYWALMDYGSMLKSVHKASNAKSSTYRKQSAFKGSPREVRSGVLKVLLNKKKIKKIALAKVLGFEKERIDKAVLELICEGFIIEHAGILSTID